MPVNNHGGRSQAAEDAGFLPAWVWNEHFPALQGLLNSGNIPQQPSVLQQLRMLYETRLTLSEQQEERPSDEPCVSYGAEEDDEMEDGGTSTSEDEDVPQDGLSLSQLIAGPDLPPYSKPAPSIFLKSGQVSAVRPASCYLRRLDCPLM